MATEQAPVYINNKFVGGKRLRLALLYIIQQLHKPVTATDVRNEYYKKYQKSRGFIDLSTTQVSLLLRNLIMLGNIKVVKRGVYEFDYEKYKEDLKLVEYDDCGRKKKLRRNNHAKKLYSGVTKKERLLAILPQHRWFTKSDIKKYIKKNNLDLDLTENRLSSLLIFLRKTGCLNYKDRKYFVTINHPNARTQRIKNKIDNKTLKILLKNHSTIVEIGRYFHLSPTIIREYIKKNGIKKEPKFKGTRIIDLTSMQTWSTKKSCAESFNISVIKLTDVLNGKDTIEGHDVHKVSEVYKQVDLATLKFD